MRFVLLGLLVVAALSGRAQEVAPAPAMTVPVKATVLLEKMRKQTLAAVVVGKRPDSLPAETRPLLNKILLQSATDFLAITTRKPTKEAYLQSLDAGLSRLNPLISQVEDRQQVAEYYQDLLEIVGLESSEGRLAAFVARAGKDE